jgi:hypothetical protein
MSKNRKEFEKRLKGKGSKTPSRQGPCPLDMPLSIDDDLQAPYNVDPLEKSSRESKKPASSVEPRRLTPAEYESLMEDMNKAGEQLKGRIYLEDGKVRIRPNKD